MYTYHILIIYINKFCISYLNGCILLLNGGFYEVIGKEIYRNIRGKWLQVGKLEIT